MQPIIRCTRRVRDPLSYMTMQLTDTSQIRNRVRTVDNIIMSWYVPLVNLQQTMHHRYVAEQFGEMILPPGMPAPEVLRAVPTETPQQHQGKREHYANEHHVQNAEYNYRGNNMSHDPNNKGAMSVLQGEKEQSKQELLSQQEHKQSFWPNLHMTPPSAPQTERNCTTVNAHKNSDVRMMKESISNKTCNQKVYEEKEQEEQEQEEQEEEEEYALPPQTWSDVQNTTLPSGATRVPLGLVTVTIGNLYPLQASRMEKWLDPAPHTTLSMSVMAIDRVFWQRTSWLCTNICHSLCWGRFPVLLYGFNVDYQNKVHLTTQSDCFDEGTNRYVSPLNVEVPGLNFSLTVADRNISLFDPLHSPLTDGFVDNESALQRVMLPREVNMRGLDGRVYRQSFWSTPCEPNLASVLSCSFGSLFMKHFNCNPVGKVPVASWLVREIPCIYYYQMEGEIEDENDLFSITTVSDRSIVDRVQKKAMNRYFDFRDELRHKLYSESANMELPR